jgi:HEAT repeat protein
MRSLFLSVLALTALLFLVSAPEGASKKKTKKDPKKGAEMDNAASQATPIGGKTFDQWLKDLDDPDPSVQENAIRTILLYGRSARGAVPKFIKMAKYRRGYVPDVSTKVNVAIALGVVGLTEDDRDAGVTLLMRLLFDEQAIVRLHAALALARIGPDAKKAIPKLLIKLGDRTTWEIRKACAMALGTVAIPPDKETPAKTEVISRLRKALTDPCHQVRVEAAQALVILGPPNNKTLKQAVITTLSLRAKNDRRKLVRIWAEVGVMRMTKVRKERLVRIGKFLTDPVLGNRCAAARALGSIGPDASSQIPTLIKILDDKDPIMVSWTCWALAQMGKKSLPAIPKLEKLAQNTKDPDMKQNYLETVKAIKTATKNQKKKGEKITIPKKKKK